MEENTKQIIGYKEEEIVKLEEILSTSEKINIIQIRISQNTLYHSPKGIVKVLNTDYNHPLRIKMNSLEINEEYFLANQEQILNLIKEICKKSKNKEIYISNKVLITDDILNEIIKNDNITEVSLTRYERKPQEQFELTNELYQRFKMATTKKTVITEKISKELEDNFDPIIGFNTERYLINDSKYDDLQKESWTLTINSELTEEELNNLKYIHPNKKIYISIDNYEFVEKIINKLIELKINPEIKIALKDKEKFNTTQIFKDSKYEKLNIWINNDFQTNSLENYKRFENILYTFINPAKEKDYSPFEKYIYAYNIAKRFKKYKEVEENQDKMESRNLYDILINEYMVCVGYGTMFRDLLNKLGISNTKKQIDVSKNAPTEDVEFAGHDRTYAYIKDPKYGIDGFYIADPTWDNSLEKDLYNYLAVTNQEMNYNHMRLGTIVKSKSSYGFIFIDENILLDFNNINDFYQRINYILNEEVNKYITKIKNKKEVYNIKEEISKIYYEIIESILNIIKELDKETYNEIITKYKIPTSSFDAEKLYDVYPTIITELGTYLDSKINNPISGKTIIDAAMVINKDIFNFNEEQEREYRNYLTEINARRQVKAFPKREIENAITGEITYENAENKFEIEEYQQESGKVK